MDGKEELDGKEDPISNHRTLLEGLHRGYLHRLHAELASYFPANNENLPYKLSTRYYVEGKHPEPIQEPLEQLEPIMTRSDGRVTDYVILNKDTGQVNIVDTSDQPILLGTDDMPITMNFEDWATMIDKTKHFRYEVPDPSYDEYNDHKRIHVGYLVYNGGEFDGQLVKLDGQGRAIYMPVPTMGQYLHFLHPIIFGVEPFSSSDKVKKQGKKSRRKKQKSRRKLRK